MAAPAVYYVLSRMGEYAVEQAAAALGVEDDIHILRDKLEWLQTFIRNGDQRRRYTGLNDYTSLMVRQTRDVAFDVEDVLDEFFNKVQRGSWTGPSCGLTRWLTGVTTLGTRRGLSRRIEKIKRRLDEISANRKDYGMLGPCAPAGNAAGGALQQELW